MGLERPENLEFLDPRTTGVAFLARTVCLRGGTVSVRPRLNRCATRRGPR